ncbi:MAG: cation:proton antiporter [Candidatus Nanohaloarchaeota archaeon]|nr:cation:proton antiporter [Candidatus Nanohaloarchaeota archaeon]
MYEYFIIASIFVFSLVLGYFLEKLKIHWLFAALFIGVILNLTGVEVKLLSELGKIGMYFMLFLIGMEIDLHKILQLKKAIIKTTLGIQVFSMIAWVSLLLLLGYSWKVAVIIGIVANCIGEAILVPILEEFRLVRTKFGSLLIGIGTLDDIFEVTALSIAIIVAAEKATSLTYVDIIAPFLTIAVLTFFTIVLIKYNGLRDRIGNIREYDYYILLSITIFFIYLAIGSLGGVESVSAFFAGILLNHLLPEHKARKIEYGIKGFGYGFFGVIFFSWVGISMDIKSIFENPHLTLLFYLIPSIAKIVNSVIFLRKELNLLTSFLAGIGSSIRFSTELVVAQYLLLHNIITHELFTAIVASSVLATIVNTVILSMALKKLGRKYFL